MNKCPFCFHSLARERVAFRCVSGACRPAPDNAASELRGYPVATTPVVLLGLDPNGRLPVSSHCKDCKVSTSQEVCEYCKYDIPEGWRHVDSFTVTVVGARGSGKTVYITVMLEVLKRYMERASRQLSPLNARTKDLYNARFYNPLFVENAVLAPTPEIAYDASAPQRDPLMWRASAGGGEKEFYLVVRDNAGEDFGRATERVSSLTYIGNSDLVLFMFDPMVLPNVMGILQGMIPNVEVGKLGGRVEEVFPNLITHVQGAGGYLALVVGKFDSLHQLAGADSGYAEIMVNPAAQFNRDETMHRRVGPYDKRERTRSKEIFLDEIDFLDAELRALLLMLKESSMTNIADQAASESRFRDFRHFAVSSLGETPSHEQKLTERGISPFRVLDPILWGLAQRDIWI